MDDKYNELIQDAKEKVKVGYLTEGLSSLEAAYQIRKNERLANKISKLKAFIEENVVDDGDEDDSMTDIGESFFLHHNIANGLYNHQKEGVLWFWKLYNEAKGGILGDDMGLGKTIQVIAFLSGMFDAELIRSVLIVMPVSLISNWQKEFEKWAPGIRVKEFHGNSKRQRNKNLLRIQNNNGVVLTTYGMIVSNSELLSTLENDMFTWDYIILDEGHKIKNPAQKTSKSIRTIPAKFHYVLTGTPVQNNLGELWALVDFVTCGKLLGSSRSFKAMFENPIVRARQKDANSYEKKMGNTLSESLRNLIEPYFLHRSKDDITNLQLKETQTRSEKSSNSWAKKDDIILWTYLSTIQIKLYKAFLESDKVKQVMESKHLQRSPLVLLNTLKLLVNHPRLLKKEIQDHLGLEELAQDVDQADALTRESGKLDILSHLLDCLKADGHRTLIFTQYRKMLDMIEKVISPKLKYLRMDGKITSHQERHRLIEEFTSNKSYSVFLFTTKVGGEGINVVAADRVIIFDPSWNPGNDDQAVNRAHRIGQDKDVVIYRFITCGTVEEKIYRRVVFKTSIMKQTTGRSKNPYRYFTRQELRELFVLEDPRFSATQQQLAELHPNREDVKEHLEYLNTLEIFGVSDHSLLFSKEEKKEVDDTDIFDSKIEAQVRKAEETVSFESQSFNGKRNETEIMQVTKGIKDVRISRLDTTVELSDGTTKDEYLSTIETPCLDLNSLKDSDPSHNNRHSSERSVTESTNGSFVDAVDSSYLGSVERVHESPSPTLNSPVEMPTNCTPLNNSLEEPCNLLSNLTITDDPKRYSPSHVPGSPPAESCSSSPYSGTNITFQTARGSLGSSSEDSHFLECRRSMTTHEVVSPSNKPSVSNTKEDVLFVEDDAVSQKTSVVEEDPKPKDTSFVEGDSIHQNTSAVKGDLMLQDTSAFDDSSFIEVADAACSPMPSVDRTNASFTQSSDHTPSSSLSHNSGDEVFLSCLTAESNTSNGDKSHKDIFKEATVTHNQTSSTVSISEASPTEYSEFIGKEQSFNECSDSRALPRHENKEDDVDTDSSYIEVQDSGCSPIGFMESSNHLSPNHYENGLETPSVGSTDDVHFEREDMETSRRISQEDFLSTDNASDESTILSRTEISSDSQNISSDVKLYDTSSVANSVALPFIKTKGDIGNYQDRVATNNIRGTSVLKEVNCYPTESPKQHSDAPFSCEKTKRYLDDSGSKLIGSHHKSLIPSESPTFNKDSSFPSSNLLANGSRPSDRSLLFSSNNVTTEWRTPNRLVNYDSSSSSDNEPLHVDHKKGRPSLHVSLNATIEASSPCLSKATKHMRNVESLNGFRSMLVSSTMIGDMSNSSLSVSPLSMESQLLSPWKVVQSNGSSTCTEIHNADTLVLSETNSVEFGTFWGGSSSNENSLQCGPTVIIEDDGEDTKDGGYGPEHRDNSVNINEKSKVNNSGIGMELVATPEPSKKKAKRRSVCLRRVSTSSSDDSHSEQSENEVESKQIKAEVSLDCKEFNMPNNKDDNQDDGEDSENEVILRDTEEENQEAEQSSDDDYEVFIRRNKTVNIVESSSENEDGPSDQAEVDGNVSYSSDERDSLKDFIVDDTESDDCEECETSFTRPVEKIRPVEKTKPIKRHIYASGKENRPVNNTNSPFTPSIARKRKELLDDIITPKTPGGPETPAYRKVFRRIRDKVAEGLFATLNETVFANQLPVDLEVKWNKRLTKTAGLCHYSEKEGIKTAWIELSDKVCDCNERVRDTLAHELCHAAAWLINGVKDGHGKVWKYWAQNITRQYPEIPTISTCHNFELRTKFTYKCENPSCNYSIGRHSKSVNLEKERCPLCLSCFQLLYSDGTPVTSGKLNPFGSHVKRYYTTVKTQNPNASHKDIMRVLAGEFSAMKTSSESI